MNLHVWTYFFALAFLVDAMNIYGVNDDEWSFPEAVKVRDSL